MMWRIVNRECDGRLFTIDNDIKLLRSLRTVD